MHNVTAWEKTQTYIEHKTIFEENEFIWGVSAYPGQFQSLKGLRINIVDEMMHKFATYWIVTCIGPHAFTMKYEADEHGAEENSSGNELDPFIFKGLSSASEPEVLFVSNPVHAPHQHQMHATTLAASKACREHLKTALLHHQQNRMDQHAQHREQGNSSAGESD
ncbi:hypothetical protein BJ912DRAFT_1027650 [Pholiota molesta]|nr:hypothetical protein BJ912DRAFT_1027650 [Pholiota molesta]